MSLRYEADTASENLEKAKDLLDDKIIDVVRSNEKAKFVKPESTVNSVQQSVG